MARTVCCQALLSTLLKILNAVSVPSLLARSCSRVPTTICCKNEYELWAGNCLTLPVANQSCGMNNIMNGPVCLNSTGRERAP